MGNFCKCEIPSDVKKSLKVVEEFGNLKVVDHSGKLHIFDARLIEKIFICGFNEVAFVECGQQFRFHY